MKAGRYKGVKRFYLEWGWHRDSLGLKYARQHFKDNTSGMLYGALLKVLCSIPGNQASQYCSSRDMAVRVEQVAPSALFAKLRQAAEHVFMAPKIVGEQEDDLP